MLFAAGMFLLPFALGLVAWGSIPSHCRQSVAAPFRHSGIFPDGILYRARHGLSLGGGCRFCGAVPAGVGLVFLSGRAPADDAPVFRELPCGREPVDVMRMKSFSQYPRSSQAGFIVGNRVSSYSDCSGWRPWAMDPEWWVTFRRVRRPRDGLSVANRAYGGGRASSCGRA